MRFRYNNWFKPSQLKDLLEKMKEHGFEGAAQKLFARFYEGKGQLMRMEPKEAYLLSLKACMPLNETWLPTDTRTLGKMQRVHEASGLLDAFEVFARKEHPDIDLTKDNSGSYRYVEAAKLFKTFTAGTFC